MEAEMIDIKHLSKSFGELKVLQNVSFRLEEGKVLVLIGQSGTGKSTLLRCINSVSYTHLDVYKRQTQKKVMTS